MKKAIPNKQSETHFLNLDLDLRVRVGLKELVAALEPDASALHHYRTFAVLELNKQPKTAEAAVLAFVKLIQQLPRPAQQNVQTIEQSIGRSSGMRLEPSHGWAATITAQAEP